MTNLIFFDTETTGLDPYLHEIWEIAYAVNDEPVRAMTVPHDLKTADHKALQMNGYWARADVIIPDRHKLVDLELRQLLTGNTLVGANISFDVEFLRKRWGVAPWHYRKIDVESMALLFFGYDRPKGLGDIANHLASIGYSMPVPDHSAGNDVETVREVYKALRRAQKSLRGNGGLSV